MAAVQKNGMHGPGKLAFKKLKILLDRMMLRRTKAGSIDQTYGCDLMMLPSFLDTKSR